MNSLSNTEIKMLTKLLEELSEVQENAGCNDLTLPLTEENKAFAEIFNQSQEEEGLQLKIGKKDITGYDMAITYYFINKLKNMVQ